MGVPEIQAKYLEFTGGLNDTDNPLTLADNELTAGQNMEIDGNKLSVRLGYVKLNSTKIGDNRFTGLFSVNPAGTPYLLAMTTAGDIKVMDYTSATGYPDGTWNTALNTGLSSAVATRWDATVLQIGGATGNVFACNGVDAPYYGDLTGAMTNLHSTDGDAPDVAKYVGVLDSRVIFANITLTGTANPLAIQWSSQGAGTTWAATDYKIFARESIAITGFKNYQGDGYIFCKKGIHRMRASNNTTYPYIFKEFIDDAQCVGGKSIVEVNGMLLFWGLDKKIYAFDGYSRICVSSKIQTLTESLNNAHLNEIWGIYYPKKQQVLFAVNTGATDYIDAFIVGDCRGFDQRNPVIKWNTQFVPANGMNVLCVAPYSEQLTLFGADSAATGFCYKMDTGTQDVSIPITANFYTKDYPMAQLAKKFDSLYLNTWLKGQTSGSLNVDFYVDGSATSKDQVTLDQTSTQTLFNVSADVLNVVNAKTVKMKWANVSGSSSTIYTAGLFTKEGKMIF